MVVYGRPQREGIGLYRRRHTVYEIVNDAGSDRIVIKNGYRIRVE